MTTTPIYETKTYSLDITEKQAVKITDKTCSIIVPKTSVWDGRIDRVNLRSSHTNYWTTRAEAMAHLVEREEGEIRNAERAIAEARKALDILSNDQMSGHGPQKENP